MCCRSKYFLTNLYKDLKSVCCIQKITYWLRVKYLTFIISWDDLLTNDFEVLLEKAHFKSFIYVRKPVKITELIQIQGTAFVVI